MSELIVTHAIAYLTVIAFLIQQWMHRKDLRDAMDGVTRFLVDQNELNWKHFQYEQNEMRSALHDAHERILRFRSRPLSPFPTFPDPGAARSASSNGRVIPRVREVERDAATVGGP